MSSYRINYKYYRFEGNPIWLQTVNWDTASAPKILEKNYFDDYSGYLSIFSIPTLFALEYFQCLLPFDFAPPLPAIKI